MKRSLPWLLTILLLSGCARLDAIPYTPPQTAATWLTIQPHATIRVAAREIILVQPTTTFFVYLLGVVANGAGLYFFRIRQDQKLRLWWGIALVLRGAARCWRGRVTRRSAMHSSARGGRPASGRPGGGTVPHPLGGKCGRHAGGPGVRLCDGRLRRGLILLRSGEPGGLCCDRAGRRLFPLSP